MNELQPTLERLEARIEDQTARIDALYRMLEVRGMLPHAADAGRGDALLGEEPEVPDPPCGRQRPRPARLYVGNATGV